MNPINASFYDQYNGGEAPVAEFQPQRRMTKVDIVSLTMIPTGTYNDQFNRPWVANHNPANASDINNVVERSYQAYQSQLRNGQLRPDSQFTITPELVACASSNFIQPSARFESQVQIAGGWAEQRVSFVMHVNAHVQGIGIQQYILTGYTNGMGLSQQGNIAPDMELIINAVYETRTISEMGPFGMQTRTIMSNASQILANYNYNGNIDTNVQLRMRPQDVIGQINIQHVPELANGAVEIVDLRAQQTTTPVKSNFQHTNPNNYLASIIAGLVSGEEQARLQNRRQETYDLAVNAVADQTIARDPFMNMMSSVRGTTATNRFTFKDLIELDQNVLLDQVTKVVWRDNPTRIQNVVAPGDDFHSAGSTQFWHGADRPTMVATMIANSVPSMMANLMLSSISLHATNAGPGGIPFMMHSGVDALIPNVDATPQAEAFKQQFQTHLLNDISHQNAITYKIAVTAHLMGEIWISLDLENFPPVDYVMPAYANSLMSPVITRNRQNLNNLALQFSELKNDALPGNGSNVAAPTQFYLPSGNKY